MTPTKNPISDGKTKAAQQLYHLVHSTSSGKPLCGVVAADVLVGSYAEHLDTSTPANVRWVREVFGGDGKPVTPCQMCLSLYPPALLDVVPFELTIKVRFNPNDAFHGYNISADAHGVIKDISQRIPVSPSMTFFSAKWIGDLRFSLDVDASQFAPFVEQTNKTNTKGVTE